MGKIRNSEIIQKRGLYIAYLRLAILMLLLGLYLTHLGKKVFAASCTVSFIGYKYNRLFSTSEYVDIQATSFNPIPTKVYFAFPGSTRSDANKWTENILCSNNPLRCSAGAYYATPGKYKVYVGVETQNGFEKCGESEEFEVALTEDVSFSLSPGNSYTYSKNNLVGFDFNERGPDTFSSFCYDPTDRAYLRFNPGNSICYWRQGYSCYSYSANSPPTCYECFYRQHFNLTSNAVFYFYKPNGCDISSVNITGKSFYFLSPPSPPPPPPSPPIQCPNFTLTCSGKDILLEGIPLNAYYYKVYRNGICLWGNDKTFSTFTDTNVTCGVQYEYDLKPANNNTCEQPNLVDCQQNKTIICPCSSITPTNVLTSTPTPIPPTCPGSSVWSFITKIPPWWQSKNGDIYGGSITSKIPSQSFYLSENGSGGVPGILQYKNSLNIGSGEISTKNWVINKEHSRNLQDFTYLKNKLKITTIAQTIAENEFNIFNKDGFWYKESTDTDFKINGGNVPAGRKIILFIDGNAKIEGNITVSEGGFFGVITKRNITINPTVTKVQGIYLADESIIIEESNQKFEGEGSFIGLGGISLKRDIGSAQNQTEPSEYFIFRPDFLVNAPSGFTYSFSVFQELQP